MPTNPRPDLLRRLAPRGAENFITDALCWTLENTTFGDHFLKRLTDGTSGLPAIGRDRNWKTQGGYDLDGSAKRPDMVCESADGRALIFEHKVDAPLHEGQLDGYRGIGRQQFGEGQYGVVLITKRTDQCTQNPDRHLIWRDVHAWLSEWRRHRDIDVIAAFVADNLLCLLRDRGLGSMPLIKSEYLRALPRARFGMRQLRSLLTNVTDDPFWQSLAGGIPAHPGLAPDGLVRQQKPRDGRCGMYLLGSTNSATWNPGLFVGVMVAGDDHGPTSVNRVDGPGPEACVVVDIHRAHHHAYPNSQAYTALVQQLRELWPDEPQPDGWQLFEGSKRVGGPRVGDRWHPVLVHKPVAAVIGNVETGDDQVAAFLTDVGQVAETVLRLDQLWSFRMALTRPD